MTCLKDLLKKVKWAEKKKGDGLEQAFVGMGGALSAKVIRHKGDVEDLGVVSRRVVTNVFVNYLVQAMLTNTGTLIDIFKYHESGTGTTAENATDTALATAVTPRATGTQSTASGSANVFQSVGTVAYTAAASITEHGLFGAATGGSLLDRSSFAAISVASGDSIAFTYQLTCSAGN